MVETLERRSSSTSSPSHLAPILSISLSQVCPFPSHLLWHGSPRATVVNGPGRCLSRLTPSAGPLPFRNHSSASITSVPCSCPLAHRCSFRIRGARDRLMSTGSELSQRGQVQQRAVVAVIEMCHGLLDATLMRGSVPRWARSETPHRRRVPGRGEGDGLNRGTIVVETCERRRHAMRRLDVELRALFRLSGELLLCLELMSRPGHALAWGI
ncbi:hypothetical protein B0T11DRAFT_122426 [Plectosphaerella cucumerina]|uniref:Uncharacterized protein n=1 Tax=Plectosphaerella cucumerina TaxID=40658 RepID=A0A8K0T6B0_9PEZI|nr:hypothetical protein B0T11DRAFT_122426 [Plectosphaerella cucumerina]